MGNFNDVNKSVKRRNLKSTKLYSNKQKWKIILSVFFIFIVISSLWYTNYITQKIQKDERLRVEIWSETVKKQAQLVNLTNQTFNQLRIEERKNIKLWTRAVKEAEKDYNDYTFITSIISDNPNIPIVLEGLRYKGSEISHTYEGRNLSFSIKDFNSESEYEDSLKHLAQIWDSVNEKITISNIKNQTQIVHCGTSKLFKELKSKSDSLIKQFTQDLIKNSALVPVIFIDSNSRKIVATNISDEKLEDSIEVEKIIAEMQTENDKIEIDLGDNIKAEIYYFESQTLKQLRFYPWIQLGIIILFLIIAYFLFSTFRKAEQNQVWAGMAKETAHQLGTPLSSLMAWMEIIKSDGVPESSIAEMNKDINRLETITDRFSKIGSIAKTNEDDVVKLVTKSVQYLGSRVSKKVKLTIIGDKEAIAKINEPLFEWVIENLTKNAVDAIQGEGSIEYNITNDTNKVLIDITDTGKGIPLNKQKSIFNPGYTTKERGWGLGLSLVKRIVEEQLNGKIFVKTSEVNKGTTFRIILNK